MMSHLEVTRMSRDTVCSVLLVNHYVGFVRCDFGRARVLIRSERNVPKFYLGQTPCSTPLQRFKLKVQKFFFRSDYVVGVFQSIK